MLTTLTMNPCMDISVQTEHLNPGGVSRLLSIREDPGGKGINAAHAFQRLGGEACCIYPEFTENGDKLKVCLEEMEIKKKTVPSAGRLRTNLKILDRAAGTYTELNQKGSLLSRENQERLASLTEEMAVQSKITAICGSLPEGVPEDYYRRLIPRLKEKSKVILDTSGRALREGIHGKPFLIKPNLEEFSSLFGKSYQNYAEIVRDAEKLVEYGISMICVSMGERGAMLLSKKGIWYAPALSLTVRGVQGAGDAMVGGISLGLEEGKGEEELLAYGVAAASASLEKEGTQFCNREEFLRMLSGIMVKRL